MNMLQLLVEKYPELAVCLTDISAAFSVLEMTYRNGGKLLICGNGGSAADCEHIVGELMKAFTLPRRIPQTTQQKLIDFFGAEGQKLAANLQGALSAISLISHTALMTAYMNDVEPDMVFAQQVYGYGKPGDVLLGISTSGNSQNVIYALQVARIMGLKTIGLTGKSGGKMRDLCETIICVPAETTVAIQERHLPIYHALCTMLEEAFFSC
jgi:D-sedoheptulose 7-phosphate isomerase